MEAVGVNKNSVGCEICKPAIGSILASLWNEHVMNPVHHAWVYLDLLGKCLELMRPNRTVTKTRMTGEAIHYLVVIVSLTESSFMANIQRNGITLFHLVIEISSYLTTRRRHFLNYPAYCCRRGRTPSISCKIFPLTDALRSVLRSSLC